MSTVCLQFAASKALLLLTAAWTLMINVEGKPEPYL